MTDVRELVANKFKAQAEEYRKAEEAREAAIKHDLKVLVDLAIKAFNTGKFEVRELPDYECNEVTFTVSLPVTASPSGLDYCSIVSAIKSEFTGCDHVVVDYKGLNKGSYEHTYKISFDIK